CYIFFFQAEDGIRYATVTEFRRVLFRSLFGSCFIASRMQQRAVVKGQRNKARPKKEATGGVQPPSGIVRAPSQPQSAGLQSNPRSEERSVGKSRSTTR